MEFKARELLIVSGLVLVALAIGYIGTHGSYEVVVRNNVPIIERAQPENRTVRMLAFGDIMLDRQVRVVIDGVGLAQLLKPMKSLMGGRDVVLANLEGSFTDFPTSNLATTKLIFTFDPAQAPLLKEQGITLVSLANNHTFNFGTVGLAQSRSYLERAGLHFFGDPNNTGQVSTIETVRGVKIGFVGYHEFGVDHTAELLAEVQRLAAETDYVVVMPHWGVEYRGNPTSAQILLAHQFIDAGADVVLGAHPHVIEPIEVYKNRAIVYSLGNFVFDQMWSESTRRGLAVSIDFTPDSLDLEFFPTRMNGTPKTTEDWNISLLAGQDRASVLSELAQGSTASVTQRDQIRQGYLHISQ